MKNTVAIASVAIAALALAACKGGQPAPQENASASASATLAATSESASAAPSQSACAPAPRLLLAKLNFGANAAKFADGTPEWTKLEANFTSAYQAACSSGWLAKKPLVDLRAKPKDSLTVANAPEANTVSLYFEEEGGSMVLEYPFVDSGNKVSVPDVDTLKEAIYCTAVGATEKEQEESGRCLVD